MDVFVWWRVEGERKERKQATWTTSISTKGLQGDGEGLSQGNQERVDGRWCFSYVSWASRTNRSLRVRRGVYFPGAPGLGTPISRAGRMGSAPSWRAKIHVPHSQRTKSVKQNQCCKKFNNLLKMVHIQKERGEGERPFLREVTGKGRGSTDPWGKCSSAPFTSVRMSSAGVVMEFLLPGLGCGLYSVTPEASLKVFIEGEQIL